MLNKVQKFSINEGALVENIVPLKTKNYEIYQTSDYEECIERLSQLLGDNFKNFLLKGSDW